MMHDNIKKNVAKELVGSSTETSFMALATAAGFPAATLAVPLVKGIVLGLLENCYNDCSQRTLSVRETKKLERATTVALQTFRELAEEDGVEAWKVDIDLSYYDYAFEVAEHATMEAIRQSESAKVDILGRYYGRSFYKGDTDWQDMHQMITMVGELTLRQIVMIRLISEGFNGMNGKLFVTNPSACVEMNRLKDFGIWQTEGAAFGINESGPLQLCGIIPTIYVNQVNKALMLDKLSEEDIHRVIDSLCLSEKGTNQSMLTEEQFNQRTNLKIEDDKLVLPDGQRFGQEKVEGGFYY
jgi:hypothetical protein